MSEHRAVFDFRIAFTNGGGLTGQGFRLDVPGAAVTADDIGLLLVRRLGLLMTASVELSGVRIIEEPHREPVAATASPAARRVVDLSHAIAAGMVTYPGLPGPEIGEHLS